MHWTPAVGRRVRPGPLPHHLAEELLWAEDRVEQQLEVVAGRGVAVEINRARWAQDAFHVDKALHHVHKVREQVRLRMA